MNGNVWGSLLIKSVTGGGYIVREAPYDPNRFTMHIFACSTKKELLDFISANLVNSDAATARGSEHTSTHGEAQAK